MLDNILTEEVFKEGLNYYLTERAYGNANSDDLWTVLTYVSPHQAPTHGLDKIHF